MPMVQHRTVTVAVEVEVASAASEGDCADVVIERITRGLQAKPDLLAPGGTWQPRVASVRVENHQR